MNRRESGGITQTIVHQTWYLGRNRFAYISWLLAVITGGGGDYSPIALVGEHLSNTLGYLRRITRELSLLCHRWQLAVWGDF